MNIREWKKRFQEERLAGLDSRYRGSQRRTRTAETEARILEATRRGPTDGRTHWSSYRLAKELGISQSSVSRVSRHFGIQPHRVRRYKRAMTLSLKRRRRTPLACILSRRSMLQCSVSMRKALSKHSTDLTRFCRSPLAEPNGMALNIFVMARSHCMQR